MRRAVVSVLAHGTRFGRAATPSSAFASPAALRQFAHSTASAQCLAAPLLPRAAQALPASNTGSRAFSRSSAAGAAEESLPDVLNVELKHELEHYETPEARGVCWRQLAFLCSLLAHNACRRFCT